MKLIQEKKYHFVVGGVLLVFFLLSGSFSGDEYNKNYIVYPDHFWSEKHAQIPSLNSRTKGSLASRTYNAVAGASSKFRRKKMCKMPSLELQVDNPYKSESLMGKIKRSYVCLRFSKQCRGQAMEELWNRRYMKKYDTYTGTFLMTDTTAINRLKRDDPDEFKKLMIESEGENYISALDGGDAISGNKAKQLEVKRVYSENMGCDYNSLKIQPPQFTMHRPSECKAFFKYLSENPDSTWIMKPILGQGGVGITLHTNHKDFEELRSCKKWSSKFPKNFEKKIILQEYIKNPLLIHGKKFDIRVYMLISSSNPYFVFYHEGYLRRAMVDYNNNSTASSVFLTNTHFQSLESTFELSDHIWGFKRFQKYLSDNNVAGSEYVSTVLNTAIKKVLLFNFKSAQEHLVRRKGSYHLFGLDFMIDDELRVHFIEANGYPGFTWSKDFPTRKMVTEMFDMLLELHETPTAFEHMTTGDMYGGFELIYSELEDDCNERFYDPCVEFANFNRHLMKKAARQVGEIHDTSRRSKFISNKVLTDDTLRAQKVCREKNLDTGSPACAKLLKEFRRSEFRRLFQEIQDWDTINQFVAGM
eukprot:snap_masked-scaffold_53-processed-gene-0.32-mRNA-1 protein AED:0.33 eAED:0.33 QI:0/-1/0/1/-1/1/1/0/585